MLLYYLEVLCIQYMALLISSIYEAINTRFPSFIFNLFQFPLFLFCVYFFNVSRHTLHLHLIMMRRAQESSNSDSQDQNIEGYYKLANCEGQISYSQRQDSEIEDSNSDEEKMLQKFEEKEKFELSYPLEKSKIIKKNCQSAKASRQRKKVYLQLLEQRAKQLKESISIRKNSINSIYDQILMKFKMMNKEKQKYLIQKIAISKKIIKMSQQLDSLKKCLIKDGEEKAQIISKELHKNLTPDTLSIQHVNSFTVEQNTKSKLKKKKVSEQKLSKDKNPNEQKIAEKESLLDLGINAYLYEFGFQGVYRMDVVERSKYQWISCLKNLTFSHSQALQESIMKMKDSLQKLQKKIKKIQFCMRQLKDSVKQKYVVQFLLDKEFFINSSQNIYKTAKGQKVKEELVMGQ